MQIMLVGPIAYKTVKTFIMPDIEALTVQAAVALLSCFLQYYDVKYSSIFRSSPRR